MLTIPRFRPLTPIRPTEEAYPERFPKEAEEPEEEEVPNRFIPLGTMRNGQTYHLDATKSFRMLVVGPPGSGKTWVIRRICDYLDQYNYLLALVNDTANEMISSLQPNTKYPLPSFEYPRPISRLRRWVAEWASRHPGQENVFSLRFKDLSYIELKYLTGVQDSYPKQRMILRQLQKYLLGRYEEDPEFTLDKDVLREIKEDPSLLFEDYDPQDKAEKQALLVPLANIYYKLLELVQQGVIETPNALNPMDLILNEQRTAYSSFVFDWSGVTTKDIGDPTSLVGSYISIPIDRLFEMRKRYRDAINSRATVLPQKVPQFFVVWDEAQPYIKAGTDSFPAKSMKTIYSQGRKEGVGLILGFQKLSPADEFYASLARYLVFFSMFGDEEISTVRKIAPSIFPSNSAGERNAAMIQTMRPHECYVIDLFNKTRNFVMPFPPRSRHTEEMAQAET